MNMIMKHSLTVIFVPRAWFASRLRKSKIRLLISMHDPPTSPLSPNHQLCFKDFAVNYALIDWHTVEMDASPSQSCRKSSSACHGQRLLRPQPTPGPPSLGTLHPGSRLGPPSVHSWTVDPGSSLVSVCQRSTFWPLFFRQSIQCCKVSPCEWHPKDTPPGRGMRGGRRKEKR